MGERESSLLKEPTRNLDEAPPPIVELVERFDPEVIDLPDGDAKVRLLVGEEQGWDALVTEEGVELVPASGDAPDAELRAELPGWEAIASDVRGGMVVFQKGGLRLRRNLHLGVGFLAATSGMTEEGRLRFYSFRTRVGKLSMLEAGTGDPVVCLHGLGATKQSFMPTVAALADDYRVIAFDFPGFGESDKPLGAAYDAPYFAESVVALLDKLGIERAHLVGNSMGGRVAIELGLLEPSRVRRIALLSPALAWLRDRRWRWLLRWPLPMLGLVQPAPRVITDPIVRNLVPGGRKGWSAAGVDEFLRSFLTPRGRVAFYEAAKRIYLDEPHGEAGLWTRLKALEPKSLFVWGRNDQIVPVAFRRHVEEALPAARHLELDCGHVPQLEAPRETHAAIREFFGEADEPA